MNIRKLLIASLLATSGIGAANAGISVGGIVWDPNSPLDFSSTTATMQQSINALTGEVSGFGVITTINGTGVGAFLGTATELTFSFGGFMPIGGALIPSTLVASVINYSGGFVNVYADTDATNLADPSNPLLLSSTNTTDGLLWLSLVGNMTGGSSLTGINSVLPGGSNTMTGGGLLDVTGGVAQLNFDTNTQALGADFSFTNSFSKFPTDSVLFATGAGTFSSDSVGIPEPATIALLGLGLLGIGATRGLKKA